MKFHDALKTIYGPNVLEPQHCSVEMEALFSQIKRLSRKGVQNNSGVCSIDHQALMRLGCNSVESPECSS